MNQVKTDLYSLIHILRHNPNSTHEYEHKLTPPYFAHPQEEEGLETKGGRRNLLPMNGKLHLLKNE
jgi:hypothetical protein